MKFLKDYIAKRVLSRSTVLMVDIIILLTSTFSVFLYWNSFSTVALPMNDFLVVVMVLLGFNILSFISFQTFAGILRFSSFNDLSKIIMAITVGYGLTYLVVKVVIYWGSSLYFEAEVLLLVYLLNVVLMIFSRIVVKEIYHLLLSQTSGYKNVFVYGTQQSSIRIAKSLRGSNDFNYKVAGFVSDELPMIGKHILGREVHGTDDDLFEKLKQMNIKKIIVAPHKLQEINDSHLLDRFLDNSITLTTTLPFCEWSDTEIDKNQFKDIQIEDLLPRKQLKINRHDIANELEDKCVLITGAGGSIGSEIARLVAAFNPSCLILIDQAETPLHKLRLELSDKWKEVKAHPIVADVVNETRLEKIFSNFHPEYIFHAAAYKHVPMMEQNVSEAIQTNIHGTKNLADLAVKYGAKKFVLISTDRAENPTNVMGCSKRISEIYVQALGKHLKDENKSSVQFITTRFGNVLGSSGSVMPYFEEQIKNGGPVTVTHPDSSRCFMTISEACQLVLQAGWMGKGGELFVFDMGEPVKILDLAKQMIRLSGQEGKIKIEFSGLRHGEKLYEELLNSAEHTKPTKNDKIMVADVREYEYNQANDLISALIESSSCYDDRMNVAAMKAIVPEFKSINSPLERIDKELRVES